MGYSNVNRPIGFTPTFLVGRVHSNVKVRPTTNPRHAASGGNASVDLALYDAYALDAAGFAYRAGPNDAVRGIVCGFVFQASPLVMNGMGPVSIDYITGYGTPNPSILGCEDAGAEFAVQTDNFTQAMVGASINLADAAPDPLFRQSRQTVTTAAVGTQFKAIDILNSPATNAYGINAVAVVRMLQTIQA